MCKVQGMKQALICTNINYSKGYIITLYSLHMILYYATCSRIVTYQNPLLFSVQNVIGLAWLPSCFLETHYFDTIIITKTQKRKKNTRNCYKNIHSST